MMAGLLNLTDDPQTLGLLSLGLRLMSTPGKFSTALGQSGLGAMDDVMRQSQLLKEQKRRDEEMKLRAEQAQRLQAEFEAQQAERRRQMEQRAAIEDAYRNAIRTPAQQALAGGGGPTVANAAKLPGLAPSVDQSALIQGLIGADPISAAKLATPQPDELVTVTPGGTVFNKRTQKSVFTAPKEDKPDAFAQTLMAAGIMPGTTEYINLMRARAMKESSHAPATQVNIGAEKELAKGLGAAAAKNIEAGQDAAQAAQATLGLVSNVRQAMKEGEVILGPGAAARQAGLRVGQLLGVGSDSSADTLARTKAVEQGLAGLELEAAALMKGQGQITEAERKIIARAAAGKIEELTPAELDVALNAIERNANRKITSHQQRIRSLPSSAAGGLTPLLDVDQTTRVRRYNPTTGKIED